MERTNFIICDNQELTALGLQRMLMDGDVHTVKVAKSKNELLSLLAEEPCSVVVIDFALFDFESVDSLLIVASRYVESRWVLLTEEMSDALLRRLVYDSHAFGIVYKDCPVREIEEAVLTAAKGERFICRHVAELLFTRPEESPQPLTTTEREIATAIAQGKSTKEIAAERFSSIHTVATHRKNIFRKLGVNTAHEVMCYALRKGWIDSAEFYI